MIQTSLRTLFPTAILAVAVVLAGGHSQAVTVTSTINLGVPGNIGTFSGVLSGAPGSSLHIGSLTGNYKLHTNAIPFVVAAMNTNLPFSATNQNTGLTVTGGTLSSTNTSGTAVLDYDNFTPGTPQVLQSISSVLSDGSSLPVNITTASAITINIPYNLGFGLSGNIPLSLTAAFAGTVKNVTFTSSGSTADPGFYASPGTFAVTFGGTLNGNLAGIAINNLYVLPDTVITTAANPGESPLLPTVALAPV